MMVGNLVAGSVSGLLILMMITASIREREWRAAALSLAAFAANLALWGGLALFSPSSLAETVSIVLWAGMIPAAVLVWIPWFPKRDHTELPGPDARAMDEREHMFSRNELRSHPRLAREYYASHPDHLEPDRAIHRGPELGEPGSTFFDRCFTPMASAAFDVLDRTRGCMPSEPLEEKAAAGLRSAGDLAAGIRALGKYYGAVDVGFTELKPYHWYSHSGRHADQWGEVIRPVHPRGVVIVVAMDISMMQRSPSLPVLLESSRQYVESAKIANVVTQYLRILGHDARAHTDANYQLMCVPAAVSAGLGELGRMGIFMHRVHGPCVRLAVVSTNAPLPAAGPRNFHMADFCRICKKCAENCPSRAIPMDKEPVSRGFRHWSIRQERCYALWKKIGTDCGFCIRVCPYTKPDTTVHRLVRWFISRNPWNQRVALFFDDLLYRRRPPMSGKNPERVLPA